MNGTQALKTQGGQYNKSMTLSTEARGELTWWVTSVESAYNLVTHGEVDVSMTTDVSETGWGCSVGDISTGGTWTPEETQQHINWLEIKAILFALNHFYLICAKNMSKYLLITQLLYPALTIWGLAILRIIIHL